MWKCEGLNREYMTVTTHWAVENDKQKSFEIKNALLEVEEFSDSAHTYNIRKASDTDLEAPDDLLARAMAEPEEFDDANDDEDQFPPLAPMHEGSAGCFAHLLNLIVEVDNQCRLLERSERPKLEYQYHLVRLVIRLLALLRMLQLAGTHLWPCSASLGNRSNFWKIVEGLVKVLTPFEDVTLQVSKEEASLSECIPYAHTLLRSIENLHHPTDEVLPVTGLETFIAMLKDGIKNRLINNQTLTLQISTLLNPRFKLRLFDDVCRDVVREAVITRLIMNRDTTEPGDQGDVENPEERPEAYVPTKGSPLTTLTDIVSERMQSQGSRTVERQQGSLMPEQELTNYLSEPVIPVRSEDGKANALDVLHYWYRHKEWPALTRLALSFLSCPLSSVTSERVFLLTGNIVSKKRCALLPDNIGRLAFIKFNNNKF
ncbi:zinc finger BED domain-containing 4 [Paramuricea clavata]|uniref:Zinc finger BED domain-containing 4 n=1 Tax=Paramuricea clavata TaxID=317549 RepID=A0A7D9DAP5_PARCT|nr:zinc finger BED domain-containing 4 [Paramuricea clavata]